MEKTCPHCQGIFETNSQIKAYCSPNCRTAAMRLRERAKMYNLKNPPKPLSPPVQKAPEPVPPPVDIGAEVESAPQNIPKRNRPRVPLGGPRRKLGFQEIPGYQMRWVNDTAGRLNEFREAGYEYVEKTPETILGEGDVSQRGSVDHRIRARVGVGEDGHPVYAFLMKQRQEWYDEDQRAKQEPVDELEKTMMRGREADGSMPDGRYIPSVGPKISRTR